MGYKITIDGSAATGKGTLTKALAKELKILNIDSGMLYRALGLYTLLNDIDASNTNEVINCLEKANISMAASEKGARVYINDIDVSDDIRTEQVAEAAAKVSKIEQVREYMLNIQRSLAEGKNVIMEGRDIGSVVFPNAELKIFLTADVEERAKRRYNELVNKGKDTTYEEVLEQIKKRDREDATRKVSPLIKTDDMIEIDTTNLTEQEVQEVVKDLIAKKGLGCF